MNPDFGGEIVWRPSKELVERSHLHAFMTRHGLADFDALMQRSTTDIAWFWDTMLKEMGVVFDEPYEQVVDLSDGPEFPRWCVGGRMNITATLLDRWQGTPTDDKPAVKWEREEGDRGSVTYRQLRARVNQAAHALRALGIARGDVVGVFMPMGVECVTAMLATIRVGGIFLPLFSGYGPAAVATRLQDAEARALFCSDGFYRRGRHITMKPVADQALVECPSVEHVIVHRRSGEAVEMAEGRDGWWHELVDRQPEEGAYEVCDADDPCMLIYTSGTTGRPKGAVHTHCGFPVKAAQDMLHGFDLHDDETLFWVSDIGWMMGPWEIFGSLLLGASMLTYDGALDYPGPDRLWDLCAQHGVTTLGISPTLIRALMPAGEEPVRQHNLSTLRKFGSTGEPWNPEPWKWLFQVVGGGGLPIINYSGGTEISGGIVCGNILSPMKPCAFSGPLPGMASDVVDEHGNSIRGQVGELVIRKPWIGMTRGFWPPPHHPPHEPHHPHRRGGQRYLDTYWSRFEGMWTHGDFAAVDADGLWYILGRSDDTIKIAGKRLGPAEAESVLVSHPAVKEAAAVGVPDETKGQALVCFCTLTPSPGGGSGSGWPAGPGEGEGQDRSTLEKELASLIARELGKPLTPKAIVFVEDLPKTRNGKIMRRVARSAWLGEDAGDLSALENPEAVDKIAAISSAGG